jgi:hypothetical protein
MARSPRHDGPGTWHLAVNRDLAKRSVFEEREGMRWLEIARRIDASSTGGKERLGNPSPQNSRWRMLSRSAPGDGYKALRVLGIGVGFGPNSVSALRQSTTGCEAAGVHHPNR